MTNLGSVLQQLQKLQIQQNAATAAVATLGPAAVSSIILDIRSQEEALINQFILSNNSSNVNNILLNKHQQQQQQHHHISMPDLDPAILGAAPSKPQSSIWGDIAMARQGGLNAAASPIPSISPINNHMHASNSSSNLNQMTQFVQNNLESSLLAQQMNNLNNNNNNNGQSNSTNNMLNLMLNENNIKDKIQQLFEQTKKEEERRRKQEEYQQKVIDIHISFRISLLHI